MMKIPTLPVLCAALAAALLIGGCSASTQTTSATAGGNAADSLLIRLRQSYASTPDLALNGDMKISGLGVTVWYDALVRSRDSLKVNLVGPFGVPVGALGSTRSSFVFFNAQEGEAIEGIPDRKTFGKLMQLDMEYDQMISMFRGELPQFPAAGTYTAEARNGIMHYTVHTPDHVETFAVNMEKLAVESYARSRTDGTGESEEFSIAFKDFRRVGDRMFAMKASVNIANGERKVAVTVEKVRDRIDSDRSCALVVPADVPRKRL
ncbi:MAG TPA: DUF4292 domain-containing protein [Candidatus Kapabacteria bacterium]|nr:DUF4292 domain-containing protein [Candidatus Kapabacteria bacterium]